MTQARRGRLSVSSLPRRLGLTLFARATTLHRNLQSALDVPVDLALTDNRRSMLHVRRTDDLRLKVRLHHMFANADAQTVDALATLCRPGLGDDERELARQRLRAFTKDHAQKVRARPPSRRVRVRTAGAVHDLQTLFQEELEASAAAVGHSASDTAAEVVITWGRWGSRAPRRTVRLGSYDPRSRLIRIHPILDSEDVPAWVVRFVIYHELLHHWVPSRRTRGKTVHHGEEFRRLEAAHQDHDRYEDWSRDELGELMRRAR